MAHKKNVRCFFSQIVDGFLPTFPSNASQLFLSFTLKGLESIILQEKVDKHSDSIMFFQVFVRKCRAGGVACGPEVYDNIIPSHIKFYKSIL